MDLEHASQLNYSYLGAGGFNALLGWKLKSVHLKGGSSCTNAANTSFIIPMLPCRHKELCFPQDVSNHHSSPVCWINLHMEDWACARKIASQRRERMQKSVLKSNKFKWVTTNIGKLSVWKKSQQLSMLENSRSKHVFQALETYYKIVYL